MASAEYRVERWPDPGDDFLEKILGRTAMLWRVARFTLRRGKVRLRRRLEGEPSSEWGPWLSRLEALTRVSRQTAAADIGDRLFVQRESDERQLRIWKVAAKEPATPEPPDLGCAPALEAIHWSVWVKFGAERVRSGGRWLCRFVSGSSSVSRHGYKRDKAPSWKGAAEDIFGVGDLNTMDGLRRIAEHIVNETIAGRLKARTVIWGDRVWTKALGWQHYGGVFHRHVHVDVEGGEACRPAA